MIDDGVMIMYSSCVVSSELDLEGGGGGVFDCLIDYSILQVRLQFSIWFRFGFGWLFLSNDAMLFHVFFALRQGCVCCVDVLRKTIQRFSKWCVVGCV